MQKTTLIILAKEPVAGRVKTRLGRSIGFGRAASLFSIMTEMTVARAIEAAERTPYLDIVIAVDQARGLAASFACWPKGVSRIIQSSGDLGDRMGQLLHQYRAQPVIMIGADAPDLCADYLVDAVHRLQRADCVIGPAVDGGYWLIGLRQRRSAPQLFQGVRWSTRYAMSDTLASLPDDFLIEKNSTLADIDEKEDLEELYNRGFFRSRSSTCQ